MPSEEIDIDYLLAIFNAGTLYINTIVYNILSGSFVIRMSVN
jgi:hypothetical protein